MRKALVIFFIGYFAINPALAVAVSSSNIQDTIDAKTEEIEKLQEEIAHYQNQVSEVQGQAQTLQSVINGITANQKKLQSNLMLTTKKIDRANLTIKQNEVKIATLGNGIISNTTALNETIRSLNTQDNTPFIELLASDNSVSDFLRDIDDVLIVQATLKKNVRMMRDTRTNLVDVQKDLEAQKQELHALKNQLADQKRIVDSEKQEKDRILAETKNQEATYLVLLNERKQRVAQLNAEIFAFESQLKFTLNPNSLPKAGSAPLAWPLASTLITQRFGSTVDAKRLYTSGSHSGVDFRAAVGTPVYAVADGKVEGVGDTDKTCYKASFGKWVFIRHTNGLATAYGHLSLIKAVEGSTVHQGDLIGYSGNTGHSTAPHLHITVYASGGVNGEEGARVATKPSVSCNGKSYRMPIAPTSAYLDPLLYFPKTTAGMFKY